MALEGLTLNAGLGGSDLAGDTEVGGKFVQAVQLVTGSDGGAKTLVTGTDSLPVALSATDNAVLDTIDAVLDLINAKLVTGTVIGDVNLGATDNAVLDAIATSLDLMDSVVASGRNKVNPIVGQLGVAAGAGVVGVTVQRATLASDDPAVVSLQLIDAVLDDIAAKLAPHATNGVTPYVNQDTSAIASVKGSAGTVYWISVQSTDATPVYLNLYDSTTAVLGTTTPTNQFIVPTQGDANGAGLVLNFGPLGIQYGTGIQVAAATTFDGSTDPGANVVITNIGYE